MYRNKLTVSRDVYHCHPDELSAEQHRYLCAFIALALLEQSEIERAKR